MDAQVYFLAAIISVCTLLLLSQIIGLNELNHRRGLLLGLEKLRQDFINLR